MDVTAWMVWGVCVIFLALAARYISLFVPSLLGGFREKFKPHAGYR